MYYRRRISNRELSGEYAHLNRRAITWEFTDNMMDWQPNTGKIVCVGREPVGAGLVPALYIEEQGTSARYWIGGTDPRYRNIVIAAAK